MRRRIPSRSEQVPKNRGPPPVVLRVYFALQKQKALTDTPPFLALASKFVNPEFEGDGNTQPATQP
jgi:hypothetical protein